MKRFTPLLACVLSLPGFLTATEYFVSPIGDDSHDGLSMEQPFATVQKGVDALAPGDTLTIAPGIYRESVTRHDLGDADHETVIRAQIPGTVILDGAVPAPEFTKLDGYRFVYVADFEADDDVQVVNELDTFYIMQGRPNTAELDFTPGTFYHDRDTGKLYISTSDTAPPSEHRYTVSVGAAHGLHLVQPRRVVVEGLAATGFNTAGFADAGKGIFLDDASDSVILDCYAWMNGWGIEVSSPSEESGRNLIENCVAWANDSPFGNDRRGGISGHRPRGDIIRDSVAFLNAHCGIYFRNDGDPETNSRLVDNLSWGNRWDLLIKGNPEFSNTMERCVGASYSTRENASYGLFQRRKRIDVEDAEGNIVLAEEEDLNPDHEFADPENRDFRLQATSRFRGTGPDGADRGPFPYEANVFFVSPDGHDDADGLSLENAWQTLDRAARDLKPGDTLYLQPGRYSGGVELKLAGEKDQPISIRGRGTGEVVIKDGLTVDNSHHLNFQRLRFTGPVEVRSSRDLAFDQSVFTQATLAADGVDGLRVTHSLFTDLQDLAITLNGSTSVFLAGNLYDTIGPAMAIDDFDGVGFSDFNAYRNTTEAWRIKGSATALSDLPDQSGRHSLELPGDLEISGGAADLKPFPLLATGGPMNHPVGPYRYEPLEEKLRLTSGPEVHSVSATTANIEWTSVLPTEVHLAWGETPELGNEELFESDYFGTFSLNDLAPGQTYYFQIKSLREPTRNLGQHEVQRLAEPIPSDEPSEVISFTTATEEAAPATYYVSPEGDDANAGHDPDAPLRTIQQAANLVNVGDTVLITEGTYEEQVRVRATGTPGARITFTCQPGDEVVMIAGDYALYDAFYVSGKNHLHFDGLYLLSMWFNLYNSNDIEISRIFAGRYGRGYAPGFIKALRCHNLLITNSVALSAKGGPRFFGCSNVRFENSVFYRNMISQVLFEPLPGQPTTVANCIFTDGLATKANAAKINLGRYDAFTETNNCYFPRRLREDKPILMIYSDYAFERARVAHNTGEVEHDHPEVEEILRLTFEEMQEYIGETDSIVADPGFAGLAEFPTHNEDGEPIYTVDRMTGHGVIPMNNFFATNPEVVERGIGLQPEAFDDYHFHQD